VNYEDVDALLERVVALLGSIERDHDEGRPADRILGDLIDSVVSLGVDCHEMREKIRDENR
jgi:hypothetical protein